MDKCLSHPWLQVRHLPHLVSDRDDIEKGKKMCDRSISGDLTIQSQNVGVFFKSMQDLNCPNERHLQKRKKKALKSLQSNKKKKIYGVLLTT